MDDATRILTTTNANDPLLLFVGAVSLLVLLVALYRGGWRWVTHLVLCCVFVVGFFAFWGVVIFAFYLWFMAFLAGHPPERAAYFLRAATVTASMVVAWWVLSRENAITRGLNKAIRFLTVKEWLDNA
jgi:hypothetical protein